MESDSLKKKPEKSHSCDHQVNVRSIFYLRERARVAQVGANQAGISVFGVESSCSARLFQHQLCFKRLTNRGSICHLSLSSATY